MSFRKLSAPTCTATYPGLMGLVGLTLETFCLKVRRKTENIVTNMTNARQRFGKHRVKAGIVEPERNSIASQLLAQRTFPLQRRDMEQYLAGQWSSKHISCQRWFNEGSHGYGVVGIATGYGLDDRGFGVRVPVGSRMFSSPRRPDRPWSPPNILSNRYRGALSPWVKRQVCEAGHSPPTSAEAKKMCICTSTPPISLHAIVLN
jgi:hypothetical protein